MEFGKLHKNRFSFDRRECYLFLLIHKGVPEPHVQWEVFDVLNSLMESAHYNMTPRGMGRELFSSRKAPSSSPQGQTPQKDPNWTYSIFVWHGSGVSEQTRHYILNYATELERMFEQIGDPVLFLLFNGAVVRKQKLQKGEILVTSEYLRKEVEPRSSLNRYANYNLKTLNTLYNNPKSFDWAIKFREELESDINQKNNDIVAKYTHKIQDYLTQKLKEKEKEEMLQKEIRELKELLKKRDLNLNTQNSVHSMNDDVQESDRSSKSDVKDPIVVEHKKGIPSLNLNMGKKKGFNMGLDLHQITLDDQSQLNTNSNLNTNLNTNGRPKMDLNLKNIKSNKETKSQSNLTERSDKSTPKSSTRVPVLRNTNLLNTDQHYNQLIKNYDPTKNEENFDEQDWKIKDTNRKAMKLNFFKDKISPMFEDKLYVGGFPVAKNLELLKKTGITHIINCSSDLTLNYFPDDFTYLNFFLKDATWENIECVFHECIDFLNNVIERLKGKVFVHCHQGVSRSVTICLCYNMFRNNIKFEELVASVKKVRGICNPNMGFTLQLMMWYDRLWSDWDAIKVKPRVYQVCSFQKEQPTKIVCKLSMDMEFYQNECKVFDSRGVYIVSVVDKNYIWIGSEINEETKKVYIKKASRYIHTLNKLEKHSSEFEMINSGNEPLAFWKLFNLSNRPSVISKVFEQYDDNYKDLSKTYPETPVGFNNDLLKSKRNKNLEDEVAEEEQNQEDADEPEGRKWFFVYPNETQLEYSPFEMDYLNNTDIFCILCDEDKAYEMTGYDCELTDAEKAKYRQESMHKYYGDAWEDIEIIIEEYSEESDDFMEYFA